MKNIERKSPIIAVSRAAYDAIRRHQKKSEQEGVNVPITYIASRAILGGLKDESST